MRNRDVAIGVFLVLLGIVLLLGQLFQFDVGHYGWPLFILVPGLFLMALGLGRRETGGLGTTVVGSAIAMTGLILFIQNLFDLYQTWAYAWTLIFPFSIGLGFLLHGLVARVEYEREIGGWLVLIGIGLFLVGALFFEAVIGLSSERLGRNGRIILSVLVILLGLGVLLASQLRRRPGGPPAVNR
jgi:hypothetical protein